MVHGDTSWPAGLAPKTLLDLWRPRRDGAVDENTIRKSMVALSVENPTKN